MDVLMQSGLNRQNLLCFYNGRLLNNGRHIAKGTQMPNGACAHNIAKGTQLPNGMAKCKGLQIESWNTILQATLSSNFVESVLGSNWINPDLLGPAGVGDLTKVPGIKNAKGGDCGQEDDVCHLDNRHIGANLMTQLCGGENNTSSNQGAEAANLAREFTDALLHVGWPANAELWLCCDGPAGADATEACSDPDFVLPTLPREDKDFPGAAPHFLAEMFEERQQEALSAFLVAKLNVHGTNLMMELAGRFDLGPAGTLFLPREHADEHHCELGQSWGNMFLDCNGADAGHHFCEASREEDRVLGRSPMCRSLPLFSCSGESLCPTKESGKACYSTDMDTNVAHGCGMVASVGGCDETCIAGFCGANYPAVEGRGTTNVVHVYMDEYTHNSLSDDGLSGTGLILAIILPILFVLFCLGVAGCKCKASRTTTAVPEKSDDASYSNDETDAEMSLAE